MITKSECIRQIQSCADTLRQHFGVSSLRLFGSVARGEQTHHSDVDVCVEMVPKLFLKIELAMFLEKLLGCHVDVIRIHPNMNTLLKEEIERDGICVF